MYKLIVFGGAGFIGTNICLLAIKKGYEVIAFDSMIRNGVEDNISILKKAGVTIIHGDIRNKEDFQRIPNGNIGGIFWMSANPGIPWSIDNPLYDFNVNALGTIHGLEFARSIGNIPFIYASTNKCYSDMVNEIPLVEGDTRYTWSGTFNPTTEAYKDFFSREGISEEFPTEGFGKYPHSPYGVSKLTGDHYCQEYFHTFGVPTVINRMSCIYGYYQQGVADQGWASHFIKQSLTDDPKLDIYGDGKQVRDMLWGEDVAELYLKELEMIDEVKGEIFNVGGGYQNTLSIIEAITEIEKISGKKFQLNYHDWRVADQRIYISNIAKVSERLNWNPKVSPVDGIQKMYEQYKQRI